jgi:hypothetical protein
METSLVTPSISTADGIFDGAGLIAVGTGNRQFRLHLHLGLALEQFGRNGAADDFFGNRVGGTLPAWPANSRVISVNPATDKAHDRFIFDLLV